MKLHVFVLLLFSLVSALSKAELVTYNHNLPDANLLASTYYEVTVSQGTKTENLMVYMSQSNGSVEGARNQAVYNASISWSYFSFSEPVVVRVKIKSDQTKVLYDTPRILPSRQGVAVKKIADNTVEFTLKKPGQYSVEFGEKSFINGLLIFADPLETDIPSTTAAGTHYCNPCDAAMLNALPDTVHTVYFATRRHTINLWSPKGHIKNIYIPGGAIVNGAIFLKDASNNGTKIFGRGHLDGNLFFPDKINAVESHTSVSNVTVQGIIISQPSAFAVRLLGKNNQIHWVKTPGGWRFNNDGLVGYENTYISNCFVWANDDGIKLYRSKQKVEDIVSWHLTNGAVFQWAWNTADASDVSVSRVDVLHGLWPSKGKNQGVFNIRASSHDDGIKTQRNFTFDDIRVETPVKVLFNMEPQVAHNLEFMSFKNIKASVTPDVINTFVGFSAAYPLRNFTFTNIILNSKCITEDNMVADGKFVLKNVTGFKFEGCY